MIPDTPLLRNNQKIPLKQIPFLDTEPFVRTLESMLSKGYRVCSYFADAAGKEAGTGTLYAVCSDDTNGALYVTRGRVVNGVFPSLTLAFPQVHLFEREIWEQTGLLPEGHPWLKPVRFPHADAGKESSIGIMDFFRIKGEEIHQVAVGPVHAGVIEPGHFRFQCHGETVHHLEISLGYQHRGIESALRGGPFPVTPFHMETVAGDTTIGHMTAYCQILETLSECGASQYADMLRSIALELERCANHTGDLGALAGDVGYLPTSAYCGRIRGDFLNCTAVLCGNRFGRGMVIPGGVGYDLDRNGITDLSRRFSEAFRDFMSATALIWDSPSVLDRFESTGKIGHESAEAIALVGPAGRASMCTRDIRQDHAYGFYRFAHIPVSVCDSGDVFARAHVRWQEVQASAAFITEHLTEIARFPVSGNSIRSSSLKLSPSPECLSVSLVEGWRGEICHVAVTDRHSRFGVYKIVDPSFHNWFGLALALRNQQISDFPLCNKSFNLSYCGFDL